MRIALISDIHANLPALEAVLADIDARSFDAIYHLGDLVGYAPWPNEVVDVIRSRAIPGVAGNYDSTVAAGYEHCGCRYEDPVQEALSHGSYEWTRDHIADDARRFLGTLPFRIDVRAGGGHRAGRHLTLVHGTPTLNTVYWTEDRPDDFGRQMGKRAGASRGDILAFGHTHRPWHRVIDGMHFVNAGSVGRPKDSDWRACYVAITLGDGATEVEFMRVEYDLELAAAGIRRSGLPAEFATMLRTGGSPQRGSDQDSLFT